MAKKPVKKVAKKRTAPSKKAISKKVAKPAAKKVAKKAAKPAKKVVKKKVAVKKVTKALPSPKKQLALPPSSKASKATPVKAVVKGRIPEKTYSKTKVEPKKHIPVAPKAPAFDQEGWNKLSSSQRRVFLATHAVKFLEKGLKVGKGDYIKSPSLEKSLTKIGKDGVDFRNMLENASDVSCCGAGILLYTDIILRGNYPVYPNNKMNNIGMADVAKRLHYFDKDQLMEIESAFERKWAFSSDDKSSMPAIIFGQKIADDRRRMAAILNNIITHGGDFRP